MWEKTGEWVVLDKPSFLFEVVEYRDGERQMLFINLFVKKWSPETLVEIKRDYAAFRECVSCPIYIVAEEFTPTWEHFVRSFGFEPLIEAECTDGESRRLFVSLKKEKKDGQVDEPNYPATE